MFDIIIIIVHTYQLSYNDVQPTTQNPFYLEEMVLVQRWSDVVQPTKYTQFQQRNSLCCPYVGPTLQGQLSKMYRFLIVIQYMMMMGQRWPYVVHPMPTFSQRCPKVVMLSILCYISKQAKFNDKYLIYGLYIEKGGLYCICYPYLHSACDFYTKLSIFSAKFKLSFG